MEREQACRHSAGKKSFKIPFHDPADNRLFDESRP